MQNNFKWDSSQFFRDLTASNRLAADKGFTFARVSGLEGFQDALQSVNSRKPIVAVSDSSSGVIYTDYSPHTERVELVFIGVPYRIDDMKAREAAMNTVRELFRQFCTRIMLERVRLEQHSIYIDDRIPLTEIDRYTFSGMACAYFNLRVTTYTNLVYNPDEWQAPNN